MASLDEKLDVLTGILNGYGSAAVAFSGGVDSTFLLAVAQEALGEKVIAVSGTAPLFPAWEQQEAAAFCRERGIRHIAFSSVDLSDELWKNNPPDRCYHCKKRIFSKLLTIAEENSAAVVLDGTNADDLHEYRPGLRALSELHIKSPLAEVGLTKAEIRELSRRLSLPTAAQPSFACLASRIEYGEAVTEEKLSRIAAAEALLREQGFSQYRVRLHGRGGELARIELLPEEMKWLLTDERELVERLRALGFRYVTMDLLGYRTGSMDLGMQVKADTSGVA